MTKLGCEKETTDVSREAEDSQGSQTKFQREERDCVVLDQSRDRGGEEE